MASKSNFCLYMPPLSSISTYKEMVDLAANYGITQLETLNILDLSKPDLAVAKELKAYAQEKGITFPCASLGLNLVEENYKEALEEAMAYVDIAAALGAPYFHHTIALEFSDAKKVADHFELYYARGIAAVRQLYDYASSLGIRTVYEDQGFLFNGVENFTRFLKDVERDVGIVADFGNIRFVDEQVEDFIAAFSDRIVHVHVKDYQVTPGGTREKEPEEYTTKGGNFLRDTLIGEGSVHVEAAFRALKKAGYQGAVSVETGAMGPEEKENFRKNLALVNQYIDTYL